MTGPSSDRTARHAARAEYSDVDPQAGSSPTLCCPLCALPMLPRALPALEARTGLAYARCRSCGWLTRAHEPERERAHYRDAYHAATREARAGSARQNVFDDVLARLGEPHGELLDIGCAEGRFLELARAAGWRASGLEISESAAAAARARSDCPVRVAALEECELPERTFAVITLFNVLDQLPDPRAALESCCRLLIPGGHLYARVPNGSLHGWLLSAAERSQTLTRLATALSPMHLHVVPLPSLLALARSAGTVRARISGAPPARPGEAAGTGHGSAGALATTLAFAAARTLEAATRGRAVIASSAALWASAPGA